MDKKKVTIEHTFEINLDHIPDWLYNDVAQAVLDDFECTLQDNGKIQLEHASTTYSVDLIDMVQGCVDFLATWDDPKKPLKNLRDRFQQVIMLLDTAIKRQ